MNSMILCTYIILRLYKEVLAMGQTMSELLRDITMVHVVYIVSMISGIFLFNFGG